jgi:hypothetical protein
LVQGTELSSENAIKIKKTLGKYLAITYESNACHLCRNVPSVYTTVGWVGISSAKHTQYMREDAVPL